MTIALPARRGRPSAEEREALGEHILATAWALLRDEGFEAFSIDRLARAGRVGKPTIYARFAGKRALLEALVTGRIAERRKAVLALDSGAGFVATLSAQTAAMLAFILSPDGRLAERLVDWIDQEPGADGGGVRLRLYDEALALTTARLEAAVAAGEVRLAAIEEAAAFWLAGLLGHARLAATRKFDPAVETAWAAAYVARFLKAFDAEVPA